MKKHKIKIKSLLIPLIYSKVEKEKKSNAQYMVNICQKNT
jgi:hypothetical protein